jgi:hypothetical protein
MKVGWKSEMKSGTEPEIQCQDGSETEPEIWQQIVSNAFLLCEKLFYDDQVHSFDEKLCATSNTSFCCHTNL